jgi:hypothetical protein
MLTRHDEHTGGKSILNFKFLRLQITAIERNKSRNLFNINSKAILSEKSYQETLNIFKARKQDLNRERIRGKKFCNYSLGA